MYSRCNMSVYLRNNEYEHQCTGDVQLFLCHLANKFIFESGVDDYLDVINQIALHVVLQHCHLYLSMHHL